MNLTKMLQEETVNPVKSSFPALYNGDCLKVMKTLPPKSIPVILTSLPFLDGEVPDDWWQWYRKFGKERDRVCIDYSIEFHSSRRLKELHRRTDPFELVIWYTKEVNRAIGRWQAILFYKMDTARYNINSIGYKWQDHFTFPIVKKEQKRHINEDPVEPYYRCLEFVKKSCDTVLDPCMGSGTTGIAAAQHGMNFLGIEINRERFELAQERIRSYLNPNWFA